MENFNVKKNLKIFKNLENVRIDNESRISSKHYHTIDTKQYHNLKTVQARVLILTHGRIHVGNFTHGLGFFERNKYKIFITRVKDIKYRTLQQNNIF